MFTTVIPIQGTFDIAKGRSSLRSQIAEHSWPSTTTVKAGALLTALGDLIVPAALESSIPIHVEFAPEGPHRGIHVSCTLPAEHVSEERIAQVEETLRSASDHLLIEEDGSTVFITAYLNV